MAWNPQAHPRAPAGSPAGGQFSAGATGAAPSNARPVGQGETGQRVHDLQARLNALGAKPPLKLDGIFGPKTLAAVRAFQQAHGLKVDGLVGPKTTAALRARAGKPTAHGKTAAHRALTHEKVGHTGQGLWHDPRRQLPAYIQHIANDLIQERGLPESVAIATAISQVKKWAAGGENVKPDTRAKAAAALAEWERLKASAHATRSAPMSEYDADGLDSSWDGEFDLPDLTGLGVADFEAIDGSGSAEGVSRAMPKLGSGARFKALKSKLSSKGASDPGALAAYIGRKKFGRAKFTSLASKARKGGGGKARRSAGELMRTYPLEDIHVLTRAEGDGTGRVVEAYATVFDTETEIHDHQGHYREVIDRAAFDQVLSRIAASPGGLPAAVKVLFNHGRTMGGAEAPEFQLPLGKPLDVRPEARGLLTRTEYDAADPFTARVLAKIREGTITAQSFVGGIIRSSPELRGPGDRHRARGGQLTTVRRQVLGLREYGPVLYPAYSGAEILGVRMQLPGDAEQAEPDYPAEYEDDDPGMDEDVTGSAPEEATSARFHQHALYAMRSREARESKGIVF